MDTTPSEGGMERTAVQSAAKEGTVSYDQRLYLSEYSLWREAEEQGSRGVGSRDSLIR
jgi:hypothetical protein